MMCWLSIVDGIHLFKGVTDTTMIHGQGWQFMRLGRYLERAYATATLLEVYEGEMDLREREGTGQRYLEQVGLLRCCTAFEAYCQVYTADLTDGRILEFLLLNRHFPHAIRYSIECVLDAIEAIHGMSGRRPPGELLACVGRVNAMLGYTSVGEVLTRRRGGFSASNTTAVHGDSRAYLRVLHEVFDPVGAYGLKQDREAGSIADGCRSSFRACERKRR